jgi:CPA1 family monovalent cation:H+ antiporter
MSGAALAAIDEIMAAEGAPAAWADRLRGEITDRIALAAPAGLELSPQAELVRRLRHAALQAERRELLRLWRDNEISDEVMHHLEEILDYQEAHL